MKINRVLTIIVRKPTIIGLKDSFAEPQRVVTNKQSPVQSSVLRKSTKFQPLYRKSYSWFD